MYAVLRSAARTGTEFYLLDFTVLSVFPDVFQKYQKTLRRRTDVYGSEGQTVPFLQRG